MKAYVMIPMNTTVQSWSLGFNFSTSLESFEVRSLLPIKVKYSLTNGLGLRLFIVQAHAKDVER